jgi:hypothetical protein
MASCPYRVSVVVFAQSIPSLLATTRTLIRCRVVKNSCGCARVVFQESPKPFVTLQWVFVLYVLTDCRKKEHILLPLMIALVMIMLHILAEDMLERRFSKQDQS